MARVMLNAEIDEKLSRRIEIAAASSDRTVGEWVERALAHELARERETSDEVEIIVPEPGQKPRGSSRPVKLRGGETMSDTVIGDRERS